MRRPHILKPNKSLQQPNNIIWFDTETKFKTTAAGQDIHYLWFGWACYQRREQGETWSHPEWFRFTKVDVFWDWVLTKTRDKTRLYLFSHNGAFDLPVMDAFLKLPALGYSLKSAIADAPPLVLTWKLGSRTIKFVDTLNFWMLPLKTIGESIGERKLDMPATTASRAEWDRYGKQDTEVIRRVVLAWLAFLREYDLGGFAPTIASQAMNAYRHRFMDTPIFITDSVRALKIDRESYLGGRTECFKMGTFEGEFYHVDVNQMYPAVMFEGEFPHKLLGTYGNVTREELEKWLKTKAVIARVQLSTTSPVYPIVLDGKLVFPVGEFAATLAGPELAFALKSGHVAQIGLTNVYVRASLFRDYVAFMFMRRQDAKEAGNDIDSWLFKKMINGFYGKWGQRGRRYETVGFCDPRILDTTPSINADTGVITKQRKFGGIHQEWVDEGESRESFPAIASYVTSYARLKIWQVMQIVGRENLYYCDTDSMVINRAGFDAIAHLVHDTALGFWKLEKTLSRITLNGPKDYIFDGVKRVKGVRATAEWHTDSIASQAHFVGLRGLMSHYTLSAPVVFPVTKVQTRIYSKGIISDNGDVLPLKLSSEIGR